MFQLNLGLAGFGLLAAAAALVVGVRSLELGRPPMHELLAACHRLVPSIDLRHALVLGLVAFSALVAWRAFTSLLGQWRAKRRFLNALPAWTESVLFGHAVRLIPEEAPRAFCAGYLRPWIYISRGALDRLSKPQLEAVLAHERHHRLRRDPLRFAAGRALADALFFVPALRTGSARYVDLAELAADEAAVRRIGARPLAAALFRMAHLDPSGGAVVGIAPERVDHLKGTPPSWRLSASRFAASLALAAGLLALALAGASLLGGARVSILLVMAQSCMPLMAALAVLALASGLHALRSLPRRRG